MRHAHCPLSLLLSTVCTLAAACGERHPANERPALTIAVAPLMLSGLEDVCYELTVLAEDLQPVWSEAPLCADRFGDLTSAISYVGTCDASDPNQDGVAEATVVLRILGLYGPDGADPGDDPDPLTDWRNPCAPPHAANGCRVVTRCRDNADNLVTFDLTVMRDAKQGFFDVAVNFDDIFCSAKVDCAYAPDGRPIELVIDPATGRRVRTVVWAFACTDGDPGGPAASSTHLYMDQLELDCGGTTYALDPSAGPGNLYPGGVGAPAPIVQAMVFEGREQIRNGTLDADKLYWSVALGLRATFFAPATGTAPSCVLRTTATASRGPLPGGVTPPDNNYPYIRVAVPLNSGDTITCSQHGLDETGAAGVATAYSGPNADGSGFASLSFDFVGAPAGAGIVTAPVAPPVNECLLGAGPCGANAICTDLTIGYTCACSAGYTGDGLVCIDVDECSAPAACPAPRLCRNTPGAFACDCPTATADDGAGGCAPVVCTWDGSSWDDGCLWGP